MNGQVLFVCLGNCCRSIMAEAMARHYWEGSPEVASAGISPLGYIAEGIQKVLEEIGVSTQDLYSKGFNEVPLQEYHIVVNLSGYNLEGLLPSGFKGKVMDFRVSDPFGDSLSSYRDTRDTIKLLIMNELQKWKDES